MKTNPLITVITVCYNAIETIEQTINSVINQNYYNLEYIIIDGGSTDGTVEIIKKYTEKISYWISEPDKGIYDAMNKGVAKASGDYVAFINADDWYENNILNELDIYFKKQYDLIYGIIKLYNKNTFLYAHGASMNNIKKEMIAHPSTFIKKDIFEELGGYNLNYKYVADYELMLRLAIKGGKFMFVDKIIANFRLNGASSDIKSLQEKNKLKRRFCNRSYFRYCLYKILIRIYAFTL